MHGVLTRLKLAMLRPMLVKATVKELMAVKGKHLHVLLKKISVSVDVVS